MKWRDHADFMRAVISSSLARQQLGPVDPRLILGWMIGEHGPRLETLEAGQIDTAVRNAAAAVNADPRLSEQVAQSVGV